MPDKPENKDSFNKDKAIYDPSRFFQWPIEVVESKDLTLKEKLEALRNWELECRLLEIADDENMTLGRGVKTLVTTQDVHKARESLGDDKSVEHSPTSKLGM